MDASVERLAASLKDRYQLERELGRGGMATVWLAQDLRHGRPVALKLLRPELATSIGAERFQQEIRVVAQLAHPHILPLLDSGAVSGEDGTPLLWYTMPFLAGASLRDRLLAEGTVSIPDAMRLTREVAGALEHAHRRGIIHRDVKPDNILLQDGQALLADFGIARAMDDGEPRLTSTGFALGTTAYMSPEQATGQRRLDARTDVYALGAVLYELLAGEPPYTGPTPQAVLTKRMTDPVPSARRLRATVPAAVDAAIMRALALDPHDRYASAAEFAAALEQSASGSEPTSASRPAATVSAVPRGRVLLGAVALAGLAIALVAVRGRSSGDGAAVPAADRARLAVLPFEIASRDSADVYLAEGLADELTASLGETAGLTVIARAAIQRQGAGPPDPAAIRRELGVGTLLAGSMQREGSELKVRLAIIDATTLAQVRTLGFQRPSAQAAALAGEIATAVTAALRERGMVSAAPSRAARGASAVPAAYDAYLRGEYFATRRGYGGSQQLFDSATHWYRRAIGLDSTFALAHVGLATLHAARFFESGALEDERESFLEAQHALALAPELPEALVAQANLLYTEEHGYAFAEHVRYLRRALQHNPSLAEARQLLGFAYMHVGLLPEALAQFDSVQALDPGNRMIALRVARVHWFQARYDVALHEFEELDRDSLSPEHATVLSLLGHNDEALARLRTGPQSRDGVRDRAPSYDAEGARALLLATAGRRAQALESIRLSERSGMGRSHFHHASYHIALAFAQLGEPDSALTWLRYTAEHGMPNYPLFRDDPRLAELRRRPDVAAFLEQQRQRWEYFRSTL